MDFFFKPFLGSICLGHMLSKIIKYYDNKHVHSKGQRTKSDIGGLNQPGWQRKMWPTIMLKGMSIL